MDELCVDVGVKADDVVVAEEKLDDVELGTNSDDDSVVELELSELEVVSVELELVVRDDVVSVDDGMEDENSSEDSVEVVDVLEDSDRNSEDDDDDENKDDEDDNEDDDNEDDEDDDEKADSDDSGEKNDDSDEDDELERESELEETLGLDDAEDSVRLPDGNSGSASVCDRLGKLPDVSKLSPVVKPLPRVSVGSSEARNENDGVARNVGELMMDKNSGEASSEVKELSGSAACVVEGEGKKSVVGPESRSSINVCRFENTGESRAGGTEEPGCGSWLVEDAGVSMARREFDDVCDEGASALFLKIGSFIPTSGCLQDGSGGMEQVDDERVCGGWRGKCQARLGLAVQNYVFVARVSSWATSPERSVV